VGGFPFIFQYGPHCSLQVPATSPGTKLAEERDRVGDNDKDSVGDIQLLDVSVVSALSQFLAFRIQMAKHC